MTEENYNYRTSQIMLRNQLPGNGRWNIPIIPKFQEKPGDFDDLLLIGFDKASADDQKHKERRCISFSTITGLNGYGKSQTRYWISFVLTARYSRRISACIWK